MNPREINNARCHHLLDKIILALELEFAHVDKDSNLEDGWYIWRNSPDWPIDEYAVFEVSDGTMSEPEPTDSYGAAWEIGDVVPYGELAGPILGR